MGVAEYYHEHSRVSSRMRRTFRFDSLRPRQNRRSFADDVFKCNFWNENDWISIKILLKVPKGTINNIPAMVR